jgi:LmbE family N-acetylglucosaminyl deacetylase
MTRTAPLTAARRCLPCTRELLAVVAHPDDESFGLGAILDAFTTQRTVARALCFTHGEASTLGREAQALAAVRARELDRAARELRVSQVRLLDYPDAHLQQIPRSRLTGKVGHSLARAELLLVFDTGGVTGHPDHRRATRAALAAAARHSIPVLAWTLPQSVAFQLNAEFGTSSAGQPARRIDFAITVDRRRQRAAIRQHVSQASGNCSDHMSTCAGSRPVPARVAPIGLPIPDLPRQPLP